MALSAPLSLTVLAWDAVCMQKDKGRGRRLHVHTRGKEKVLASVSYGSFMSPLWKKSSL